MTAIDAGSEGLDHVFDAGRLQALADSGLLSADIDPALDRWTRLSSGLIGAPVALLSLVDADRQYFKSHVGLSPEMAEARETSLSGSFCKHVVARRQPLIISDAREHPLVANDPAMQESGVLAYAGLPVTTSDGNTLGSFCVVDTAPRRWTADELLLLEDLAAGLIAEIELRAALRRSRTLGDDFARQARIDALTGLANRRQLADDLAEATEDGSWLLAMFDLDGFKSYNDAFGHPAGDGLLARVGGKLAAVAADYGGTAYRLGGDEFCLLCHDDAAVEAAAASLGEHGEGFSIGSSHGSVRLAEVGGSSEQAMVTCDQRLYAQKHGRSGAARKQVQDVLLRVLHEREPDLDAHVREVAVLAQRTGAALGLQGAALDTVALAGQMHDIGKMAIPDSILLKPGPLDEAEWAIMERHTLLGERILAAAPALGEVATIVRSSHERWDGTGYPDGLAGTDIPLGARIVAVCDAFHAMTSDRPYAAERTVDGALAELQAHAGEQFDPAVVAALAGELAVVAGSGRG